MEPADKFAKSAWMLASIAVVVAALYLAKGILAPMTLAVLLSFLLSPVCDWFERRGLSRIPAVLFTAILGFTVLGAATWTVVAQTAELAPRMPEYQRNLESKLHSMNVNLNAMLNKATKAAKGISENLTEPVHEPKGTDEWPYSVRMMDSPVSPLQVFGGAFGTILEVLGTTGMIVILVVFFLVRRDDLRDRFIRLVGQGDVTRTTQMLEDASKRVSRYLSMQMLLNGIFGTAVGIGLSLIGVPHAILWGIMATILKFIPYLGSWIAAVMPVALSMAISVTWMAPALTLGLFVVLEFFSGNILEPWLYGRNTGVSAVAVLLAAVFWTWLWGVVGLLLATPLTVCLLVIGKHVPQLSFLDTLLGNEPVFEPKKRIYQRLLARDQDEATELFDDYLKKSSLVEVYDQVLIPALVVAERHWRSGELDDIRHQFIQQSLKEIIQQQEEPLRELREKADASKSIVGDSNSNPPTIAPLATLCVLCLPAHGTADEIAGMMLAQTVEIPGCQVEFVAAAASANDLVDLVVQRKPAGICISAAPPSALMRARYLCSRLRLRFPEMPLVVGLWDAPGDLKKAIERIGNPETTHIVATLADAEEQIRTIVQTTARVQ